MRVYETAQTILKLQEFDFQIAPHSIFDKLTLNVGTISGGLKDN